MKRLSRKWLIVTLAVLAAGVVAIGYWRIAAKPDLENVTVVRQLVARHYLLPDETPALATVTDQKKLTSDFLKQARDGDKILIYKNAKKVLLYRPSIDKLVEVGPISIAPAN